VTADETASLAPPALAARFDALAAALAQARDIAAAGGQLDLSGLDNAAAQLCSQALAVPPGERPGVAEKLAAIGAALEALAAALASARSRSGEGTGSRSARAQRAYTGAPASRQP